MIFLVSGWKRTTVGQSATRLSIDQNIFCKAYLCCVKTVMELELGTLTQHWQKPISSIILTGKTLPSEPTKVTITKGLKAHVISSRFVSSKAKRAQNICPTNYLRSIRGTMC